MIDEIDYFPKRDKYKKKKVDDEWNELKKIKTLDESKQKSGSSSKKKREDKGKKA